MTGPRIGVSTARRDTLDGRPDAIMVLNHAEAITHLNHQAQMPAGAVGGLPAPPLLVDSFHDITARQDCEACMVRLLSDAGESRQRVESLAAETIAQAEALAASESRLRLILESVKDGYWDWDIRNRLVHFNSQFAELLDLSAGSPLPFNTILAQVLESDVPTVTGALVQHLQGKTKRVIHECRLTRSDGKLVWVQFRGQVTARDSKGRALRATGLLTDISDQKQLEHETRRTLKLEAVGELAAGVAHEINTPLQYVGDNLSFLRAQCDRATKVFQLVDDIRTEVAASPLWRTLGHDLLAAAADADLTFAKSEFPKAISEALTGIERVSKIVQALKEFAYQGPLERAFVDLNRMVDNTVNLTRNEWKYVADIATDLDHGLPLVRCVPHECGQLLVNLVVNAAHAIGAVADGKKGVIGILTRSVGDQVEIEVSDTGCGIAPDVRDRIFDPFFTTKPIGQGTGQGLTLAQAIVKRHGGKISVKARGGGGTVFSVRLPVDLTEANDEANPVR